jgi:hypothetical protein
MTTRRGFLAGILAAAAAPAIVHNPMRLWVPRREIAIAPFPFAGDPALFDAMKWAQATIDQLCGMPGIVVGVDYGAPGGDRSAWSLRRGNRILALA